MSSPYPVLKNRPVDQWKVTELKEELRRRRLPISGLKGELVKRLSESIYSELEAAAVEDNGISTDSDLQGKHDREEPANMVADNSQLVTGKAENDDAKVDKNIGNINDGQSIEIQNEPELKVQAAEDSVGPMEDNVASTNVLMEEKVDNSAVALEDDLAAPAVRVEGNVAMPAVRVEDRVVNSQYLITPTDLNVSQTSNEKHEEPEPQHKDAKLSQPELNNQVSEISTDLGFQVTCESISTASILINKKNELKDNLNADNFRIEIDVKSEMVQPSSSNTFPVSGDEKMLNVNEGPGDNQVSLPEIDDTLSSGMDLNKKMDCRDGGSLDKLNIDRNSGEDSLDEGVLENKHVDSTKNFDNVEDKSEIKKVYGVEEKIKDNLDDGLTTETKGAVAEELKPDICSEKRKLEGHETVQSSEAPKRQRRWNSEAVKAPELARPMLISPGTPKEAPQLTPRRSFSRSDSGLNAETPTERVVPPSQRTATTSLRIDQFLRPFTLKAVQELLAKTGTICDFWMDHIKTHCYVTYSSMEEAVATRNALYNLQWPPNGGRQLVADFVDPQEVKTKLEAPPPAPVSVTPSPNAPSAPHTELFAQSSPRVREQQHQPPLSNLPPPPPLNSHPLPAKERLAPPPPPQKKPEPPVVTLDDLFKKTKATPRIYYFPLSEDQVAAKVAARGKSIRD